jgi:hypothetical protein
MADDYAPKIVRAEMNECLNLGSGEGRVNDRFWVRIAIHRALKSTGAAGDL